MYVVYASDKTCKVQFRYMIFKKDTCEDDEEKKSADY